MPRLFLLLLIWALCTGKALAQELKIRNTKSDNAQCAQKPAPGGRKTPPTRKPGAKPTPRRVPLTPVVLPVQELSFQRLTTREIWWRNPPLRNKIQASARRFIGFRGMAAAGDNDSWYSEKPALLYRKNRADTVWVRIPLALPDYGSHFDRGTLSWDDEDMRDIEVDTCNLDGRGEAEVLVAIHQSHYGSGGGQNRTAINLIDVSDEPKLLLGALTEVSESWHGSGDSRESGSSGARRPIRLKPALRIGKIITEYRLSQGSLLTPLPPGRYHYRNGHLVRVGQ